MIISKVNRLVGLTAADITAPTPALGYADTDLVDGTMARVFKTSTSATTHDFTFANPSGFATNLCAVFDAHPSTGSITSIQFYSDAVLQGSVTPSTRGDGAVVASSLDFPATWKVRFNLSTSATLTVGAIWIGAWQSSYAPRNPTAIRATRQQAVVRNGDFSQRSEPYRMRFSLPFDRMLAADFSSFLTTFDSLVDGTQPFVLIPDENTPSEVYLGNVVNDLSWEIDFPVRSGLSIEFLEQRRSLGA